MKLASIFFIFMAVLIIPALLFGHELNSINKKIIVLEKPDQIISEKAFEYFNLQKSEKIKIWVFFNDKNIFSDADFDNMAQNLKVINNSLNRRSKVNKNQPTFADLPVSDIYINRIIETGAVYKRASRWLNAASFEIDKTLLNQIATLPFVNQIKPVAKFKRSVPSVEEEKSGVPEFAPMEADALDYGASATQMNMINAPAAHELGYNGQGIIVTIIDSGYRKDHETFATAYDDSRVLGEYDFINNDGDTQNEDGQDLTSQHSHGTKCWSILGGYSPGNLIGPAYGSMFLLAKTEDMAGEYVGEEDNWVAAMEWADSAGTDVISTSLGYSDWYTYEDFDGATAITSIAASTAAGLGIIIAKSNGNGGPADATITAPADAFDILSTGAVDYAENIASFSSRGPTADGRIKPEVCAMGYGTSLADPYNITGYTTGSGTSFAAPLIGGAAAVLLSANPTLTPLQVRAAFMQTADNAGTPNNTYGWGIINLVDAINWGANFTVDNTSGNDSLTVQFTDSSLASASNWKWYFGDGDSSDVQNPSHKYTTPGTFNVTLIIDSDEGQLQRVKNELITVMETYLRGDANNSKSINILDITYLISYLYKGGPAPEDLKLGDADSNLTLNILDITYLISYLYKGGPAPGI
ncbi:MAG: S8 family serine peptidase [Candidatus Zixiibacteriota bacterium]